MLLAQLSCAAALFSISISSPKHHITHVALLALWLAFSAATQDIAIDAWRIESAPVREQGAMAAAYLNGQMEKIHVPFLITHGQKDRQIPVKYAHQSYDQLVNSPRRELKIFSAREGGVEHVGADNMAFGRDFIADWVADVLGGHNHS